MKKERSHVKYKEVRTGKRVLVEKQWLEKTTKIIILIATHKGIFSMMQLYEHSRTKLLSWNRPVGGDPSVQAIREN